MRRNRVLCKVHPRVARLSRSWVHPRLPRLHRNRGWRQPRPKRSGTPVSSEAWVLSFYELMLSSLPLASTLSQTQLVPIWRSSPRTGLTSSRHGPTLPLPLAPRSRSILPDILERERLSRNSSDQRIAPAWSYTVSRGSWQSTATHGRGVCSSYPFYLPSSPTSVISWTTSLQALLRTFIGTRALLTSARRRRHLVGSCLRERR